ncbi:MAG: RNA 2',3'-cyclic phosphodiesterase, partial [Candidatus Binataceae bacterium]
SMDKLDGIRAFIAVRLEEEVEDAITAMIQESRRPGDGIGWVKSVNLHLTLRFLGDAVDAELLPPLIGLLRIISADTAAFTVRVHGAGAFPNLDSPRVIWIGLESADLISLAARVEEASVKAGFAPERRRYSPHLTIGRIREPSRAADARRFVKHAADSDFGISTIHELALFRSLLSPQGAAYHQIASFRLTAGS